MKKQDLTMYGDGELSLLVMNDEPLYKVFMRSVELERFNFILDHVNELFTFTQEQEDDLRETWEDEVNAYLIGIYGDPDNEEEPLSLSSQSKASQPKKIEDNKELTEKILDALNKWAIQFKLMGFPNETPRYTQLMTEYHGAKFCLRSTLNGDLHRYIDGLTDEENRFLELIDHDDRWNQYKELRNKFLAENHPTISLI